MIQLDEKTKADIKKPIEDVMPYKMDIDINYAEDEDDDSVEQLLALISKNAKKEYDAIEEYFELLDECKNIILSGHQDMIVDELVDKISEIISDELEHVNSLTDFIVKLSNIQPAKD